jgi:hypothetical protein
MLDGVLPYLRDAAWSGWSQLGWTEPPGFEPGAWVPRMGFMVGGPGARRLLGPNELGGAHPDQLAPTAIANLARYPAQWTLLTKAGGVLGVGARAAMLEVRDELAAERMLLPMFIEGAQRQLMQPGALLFAPMRGILRATLAAGEPAIEAVINKEKGDAVMAYDATVAAGGEAVSAGWFRTAGAPGQATECIAPVGVGRDRAYVPAYDRIVPKLEGPDARLWWEATPHRTLGALGAHADNPHAPRLTLGVRGPTRFHHLLAASYQALRTDFASLERVAMTRFAATPMVPEEIDGGAIMVGGFRGTGAAEQLLVGPAMLDLHRRLGAPILRVVIPTEGVLGAVPAPAAISDGDLLARATRATGGWVTLSGAIHLVENGVLQQSTVPR